MAISILVDTGNLFIMSCRKDLTTISDTYSALRITFRMCVYIVHA